MYIYACAQWNWPEWFFRLSLKSHFFKLCCWLCVCVCVCVCVHVQIIAAMFWFLVRCFVTGYVPEFGETAHKKNTHPKTIIRNRINLFCVFFILVPSCHFDYFLFYIIVPSCHFDLFWCVFHYCTFMPFWFVLVCFSSLYLRTILIIFCFSSLYLHAFLSISEIRAFLLKTCL